jgi:hypothetical protein
MSADNHSNRDIRRTLVHHFDVVKLVTDGLEPVSELTDADDRRTGYVGLKAQTAVRGWMAPYVGSILQDR